MSTSNFKAYNRPATISRWAGICDEADDLLKEMSFGVQVAEDEVNALAGYFVETNQWARIAKGDIDIIRGEKGAGKSAIYSLLTTKADTFFDRGILLVAAENPRAALKTVALPPRTINYLIVPFSKARCRPSQTQG